MSIISNDYALFLHDSANPLDLSDIMLLWTDPPYGTGKRQSSGSNSYLDSVRDLQKTAQAIVSWLPCMHENGTVAVCCDYRLSDTLISAVKAAGWHYRGEVIWEFGLGRPRNSWWPVKHNNIHTITRTDSSGKFDATAIPRAKRLAPKKGYTDDKPAGSVWELTLSNTDSERVDYPNQKPLALIKPFILAHTSPGELVVDPFMGSGSTGVAAVSLQRKFVGLDTNPAALEVAAQRLK